MRSVLTDAGRSRLSVAIGEMISVFAPWTLTVLW